jgi:hypothetical protein
MSTTKNRLNAVQEIMNILEKFNSADREQILQCVNGESNIELNKEKKKPEGGESNSEFISKMIQMMDTIPKGDVMATLFYIFRESIEEANEDKSYFLKRLEEMNEIAEAMADYLRELTDAAVHLECSNEKKVKIKLRRFKISDDSSENEDSSTYVIATEEELAVEILNLELLLEETRNKRQEFTTMFENFDQKANQLFNILSTVMKSIKEMNSSVTRNIL